MNHVTPVEIFAARKIYVEMLISFTFQEVFLTLFRNVGFFEVVRGCSFGMH